MIYSQTKSANDAHSKQKEGKRKPALDWQFFAEFRHILQIIVPGVWSTEFATLVFHTVVLIWRTMLSMYIAELDGRLVQSVVQQDKHNFVLQLAQWLALSVPATFTNSLMRFLESHLTTLFRARLISRLYDVYFSNHVYYKVSALDTRLRNPEHLLTEDASDFASVVGHLYGQVTKPLLDIAILIWRLRCMAKERNGLRSAGFTFAVSVLLLAVSVRTLRAVSPQFGRLVAEKEQTRAAWHYLHSRLIQNVEEVAFYRGGRAERALFEKSYLALQSEYNVLYRQRLWYIALEQFIMRYMWTATGECDF